MSTTFEEIGGRYLCRVEGYRAEHADAVQGQAGQQQQQGRAGDCEQVPLRSGTESVVMAAKSAPD